MNIYDYIQEGMRQLDNQEYYSLLEKTQPGILMLKILYVIKQATNLNITTCKNTLEQIPPNTQFLHASQGA